MKKNKNLKDKKINYVFLEFEYVIWTIAIITIILLISFSISLGISLLFINFLNKLAILLEITNMSNIMQILLASLISIFMIIKYPLVKTNFGIIIVDKLWISSRNEILWQRHWIQYTKIITLVVQNNNFNEVNIKIKKKINNINKIIQNYLMHRL